MKPGNKYFYTSISEPPKIGAKLTHQMVSMDVTANKYFVYSEGGILIDRVDFSEIQKHYGNLIQVSNNGRNFIL